MRLYSTIVFNKTNAVIVDQIWNYKELMRIHDAVFILYRIHVHIYFTSDPSLSLCKLKVNTLRKHIRLRVTFSCGQVFV